MNLFVKQINSQTQKTKPMITKGESGGRDKLGGCDEQTHTARHKGDNQ